MSMIGALRDKKINLNQIISLVVLVIAVIVALNIHQKQNKKIAQIIEAQNEQIKKKEILPRIGDLKKKVELYKETFIQQDSREIIHAIMNLAAITGVNVVSLKPQEGPSVGRKQGRDTLFEKIVFVLTIQVNSYHQLARFISTLENNLILFGIQSLDLAVDSAGARPEELKVNLIIDQMFLK